MISLFRFLDVAMAAPRANASGVRYLGAEKKAAYNKSVGEKRFSNKTCFQTGERSQYQVHL